MEKLGPAFRIGGLRGRGEVRASWRNRPLKQSADPRIEELIVLVFFVCADDFGVMIAGTYRNQEYFLPFPINFALVILCEITLLHPWIF